jgi:hypothetical protein
MELLQTHNLSCPYCGELIQITIDCSVSDQQYIEDCQVCCRPINFHVNIDNNNVEIQASAENE